MTRVGERVAVCILSKGLCVWVGELCVEVYICGRGRRVQLQLQPLNRLQGLGGVQGVSVSLGFSRKVTGEGGSGIMLLQSLL